MVFTKWGGLPHWEYDAFRLGEDEHGTWLGIPTGTLVGRPRRGSTLDEDQVVLVPDAGFVATFFAAGGRYTVRRVRRHHHRARPGRDDSSPPSTSTSTS